MLEHQDLITKRQKLSSQCSGPRYKLSSQLSVIFQVERALPRVGRAKAFLENTLTRPTVLFAFAPPEPVTEVLPKETQVAIDYHEISEHECLNVK